MTLAVKYFTGKKGLSRKTATPGSVFDQIAVVVVVVAVQFSYSFTNHGILTGIDWLPSV